MSETQPPHSDSRRKPSWTTLSLLLLLALAIAALFWQHHVLLGHREQCFAPPALPISLRIVYQRESMLKGGNCILYWGTVTYTFRNEQTFPVTLAFPPICDYSYSRSEVKVDLPPVFHRGTTITWQDLPFPDEKRAVPDFAREQRDVVIPAGESVAFTSPFDGLTSTDEDPWINHAFVFGMPRSPCTHPVLGTIYGTSVEWTGTPRDVTATEPREPSSR